MIIWILSSLVALSLAIFFTVFTFYSHNLIVFRILAFLTILAFLSIFIVVVYFAINNFAKSRDLVKKSFNNYIEDIITNNNFGIIIFDSSEKILWMSNFIRARFSKKVIGSSIKEFFDEFAPNVKNALYKSSFNFQFNNLEYEVQVWPLKNTISIRDVTYESNIIKESKQQKIVIGEIEIDNFQLYQSILSEEQLFNINKCIINSIEKYVKDPEYNLFYRQYTNGKYVIICNELTLEKLLEDQFRSFLSFNDSDIFMRDNNRLSISAGFARGWPSLNLKIEQAKKALLQAQNRGGDQVAIFSNDSAPIYFGSSSEIMADNNRTEIKLIAHLFEKKLQSSDIQNVIIYGHSLSDLDAVGSAYAIYKIAKNYGKRANICNYTFDSTADKFLRSQNLLKSDIFIKSHLANKITNEHTLVVFVDNSNPNRTDNKDAILNAKAENIFIFDHHRVGESVDFCPRSNRYIDPNASSACEIVTELITFMNTNNKISANTAQFLLNGIYLDTAQFTKSVTPRAFSASSWLESKGARGSLSSELLKIDEKTAKIVQDLLKNVQEIKKGYYLAYSNIEVENDIISIAANEILKISGRHASFVVAKLSGTNKYKLSARGMNTNVQVICEAVGGGGHFSTAAAVTNEPLDVFVDNIKQAIVGSLRDESNID
nr:DHH family phosphoesterase [Mycoplasmopsis pullorum]